VRTQTHVNPVYDYVAPPELGSETTVHHPLVVVGAGPVGMSAALDAAQQGIPALILDDNNTVSVGSRAVCYAKRALEILDRLGCGQRMVEKGLIWNIGKVFFRQEQVYSFDLLPEQGHERPAFINLQQYYLEQYLVERIDELDSLELRWKNLISPKSPAARTFRDATLLLSKGCPFARSLVNSGRLSLPASYRHSPLNTADEDSFTGPIQPGTPACDAPVAGPAGEQWFLRVIGSGCFYAIYFTDGTLASEQGAALTALTGNALPTRVLVIGLVPGQPLAPGLGHDWRDGKIHLPLRVDYNGEPFGRTNAGVDMTFSFPRLIAHAARTRPLGAGCIIGSGTVSNKQDTAHGSAIRDGGVSYSCIAELRMIETIHHQGQPVTGFMGIGDRVRIHMQNTQGQSIFGSIDQQVVKYGADA